MGSKKFIISIIFVAFIAGFLGSLFSAGFVTATPSVNTKTANILDNFLNFIKGTTVSPNALIQTQAPEYKPVQDYEKVVINSVQVASPSVVSIVITKDLPVIERCPANPFSDLPPDVQDFFGNNFGFDFSQPCQQGTKKQEIGGGSGFIITADGMIVTNNHVVSDTSADYTVLTNDGKKYNAKVLARDPVHDLAVLKIDVSNLSPATLGDSDSIRLGQTAIAIGNALGEFRNTVSVGVISGLARNITASNNNGASETIQNVIQTDAAINPGNSGGPLLNLKGEVIGINTAIVSGAQNIGFAIPVNQVKQAINSVKATGSIKIPYLGIRYVLINSDLAAQKKLSVDYGALVGGSQNGSAIIPNSPAAKAGIMSGDIILEINGTKINASNPLDVLIQKYNINDVINLKIMRGTETRDLKVTLEERPANL